MGGRRLKLVKKALIVACFILFFLFYLFPVYWIFSSSFKPTEEIMSANPRLFPVKPTLEHYTKLFDPEALYGGFERGGRFFLLFINNSLIVALGATAISLAFSVLGGYALSRFKFRGSQVLSRLMLMIYLFPGILILIPIYELMSKLQLLDTHLSLILLYTAFISPFGVWILRAFFDAIPVEIEEAALVDGAGRLKAFFRVILPLAGPGIITVTAYAFITSWGEYLFASILIFSDYKKTVPPGLAMYMGYQYIEWGSLLSGSVIVVLPVLLLFLPMARRFLRGFTSGALKF